MTVLKEVADHEVGTYTSAGGTVVRCAEDLRKLTHEELVILFGDSPPPSSIRAVEGDPAGVGIGTAFAVNSRFVKWLRRKAESPGFVWHGKSFTAITDHEGWGWNRLGAGPFLGAFPFRTYIGPSKVDGRTSMILDFNVPKNPPGERQTWDELREVLPGVMLGASGLRLWGGYHHLLWFACDANRQTPSQGL